MDFESFLTEFPIRLNEQQREAVQAVNGPVLLLAVPGSGKTTVLVARLGYMIYCCNIAPSNILTLTYTVAATNDMRERFSRFFGAKAGAEMEFRTINSICAGVIKQYGQMIGKTPYEIESDEKVLLGIISTLYQKFENEYPTESDLKGIKTWITYIKNMMLTDEEIGELEDDANCHLADIYNAYCRELKQRGRMDYDDQMVYAYRLLKSSPQLLDYYRNLYPYICVDEAQDTSKIQHEIIALLASKTENLFMVGDEDQSIYGFRAAYPEALLSFEVNHPNAKVLLMEENFRSNANIVEAADSFIQMNKLRHVKHMRPTKASGSEIRLIPIDSRTAQYAYLAKVAQDCSEQTAVLYRDNESAIPLIDLLDRKGFDYRIRNAELSFFTHRVVVDIRNILAFSFDLSNTDLFELIYYKLSFYLNKQAAMQACEISKKNKISVFSAILLNMDIKPQVRKSIKALETHFNNMRGEVPSKAITRIVQFMGYGEYLERSGLSDAKIFTLKTIAYRENTIPAFMDRLDELKNIVQNKENDKSAKFILSTIHASKGLEYDNVYLIDVQDGIFPESVPIDLRNIPEDELGAYEEERRLFYVGVTRAKHNLNIFKSHEASVLTKHLLGGRSTGDLAFNRFVSELAPGIIVIHRKYGRGAVSKLYNDTVKILFDGEERTFKLAALYQNRLLEIEG